MDVDNDRPDLYITIGSKQWLIDVTIRHPLAPSHVEAVARNHMACIEAAEKEKHGIYKDLVANTGITLVPFVVETTGRLGTEAKKFLNKELIAEAASYRVVWAPKQVVYSIYREITMAVVKGNAAMFASNARKCQLALARGLM